MHTNLTVQWNRYDCGKEYRGYYLSIRIRSSFGNPFQRATRERISFSVPGAISSCIGIVIVCSPAGVVHLSWAWLPRCLTGVYPSRERAFIRSFPLTTGSPGNGTYLGLGQGKDADTFPFQKEFFKMERDCLADICHQLIEGFSLGEDIDTDTPAAPVCSIGIYLELDQHGSTPVVTGYSSHAAITVSQRPV